MAKTKAQKAQIVATIEQILRDAAGSVFVHFRGIDVAQETALRKGFRADGLGYTVAKKSLIRRTLDTLGHEHASTELDGEVAIAYNAAGNDDPTSAPRRVHAMGLEIGVEKFTILGGIFQGAFVNADGMREISMIPPLPVLRGMFVNVINSPIQGFVVALNQIAEKKTA